MASFDVFLEELKNGILQLAEKEWSDLKGAAVADGNAFVQQLGEDLKNWTAELARGEISQADFKWLLEGKKDLAALEALKQAGLLQARLQKFVNGVIEVVVNTAVKVFLV
jgi:hypothetical protein